MTVKNLEIERAKFAYKKVSLIGQDKEYKSYVKKLPQMILNNGLGNAIAFINSKKNGNSSSSKSYKKLYSHIEEYLKQRGFLEQSNNLIKKVVDMDSKTYLLCTKEVLAYVKWLKRFAEGMIKDD